MEKIQKVKYNLSYLFNIFKNLNSYIKQLWALLTIYLRLFICFLFHPRVYCKRISNQETKILLYQKAMRKYLSNNVNDYTNNFPRQIPRPTSLEATYIQKLEKALYEYAIRKP